MIKQNLIKNFFKNKSLMNKRRLTAGWFSPKVFSRILSASFNRLAASLYLFWSLIQFKNKQKDETEAR